MYCKKCGAELREGDAFCSCCGRRVEAASEDGMAFRTESSRNPEISSKLILKKVGVPKWITTIGIISVVVGAFLILFYVPMFIKLMSYGSFYRRSSYVSSNLWWSGFCVVIGILILIMGILWLKAPMSMKNNTVRVFTDKVELQCVDSPISYNQVLKHALIGGSSRAVNATIMFHEISSVACIKTGRLRFLEIETKNTNKYKVFINDAEEIVNTITQYMKRA